MNWIANLPVGTVITLFGLLAMFVTIWPPQNRWSKVAWIAVFMVLTVFEVRNMYRDRDAHDREEAATRERERKAFEGIAQGLNTSISNNQKAFDAQMRRMEQLSGLSREALGNLTGGDTFCYFTAVPNMGSGEPITYPLTIWVQGKYPMPNVVAQIQTVIPGNDPESVRKQFQSMRILPLGNGTLRPGVHPINARVPLGRHIITIWTASNEMITESMELKLVNGQFVQSIDVWSKGKMLYATPDKKPK